MKRKPKKRERKKKLATIVVAGIRDPRGWSELLSNLGLPVLEEADPTRKGRLVSERFEPDGRASLELVIDEDLKVVSGRFRPSGGGVRDPELRGVDAADQVTGP